jgi:hypothetical protein
MQKGLIFDGKLGKDAGAAGVTTRRPSIRLIPRQQPSRWEQPVAVTVLVRVASLFLSHALVSTLTNHLLISWPLTAGPKSNHQAMGLFCSSGIWLAATLEVVVRSRGVCIQACHLGLFPNWDFYTRVWPV